MNVNFEAMNEEIKNIIEDTSMGKLEKEAVIKSLLDLHSVMDLLPTTKEVKDKFTYEKDWEQDEQDYKKALREGAFWVISKCI